METDIKDYWYTHHDITIPDCNNIDWQSSRWVAKGLPVNKQRLFHNFQPAILVIAIFDGDKRKPMTQAVQVV